jgi:deoxyribodipyrimidine photo-lyase
LKKKTNLILQIGNDPREDRHFNMTRQSMMYDPDGDYLRYWLPELSNVPAPLIHEPWRLSPLELREAGVELRVDYPERIVVHLEAVRHAREIVRQWRGRPEFKPETTRTLARHGSRKTGAQRRRKTQTSADNQLSLFSSPER